MEHDNSGKSSVFFSNFIVNPEKMCYNYGKAIRKQMR